MQQIQNAYEKTSDTNKQKVFVTQVISGIPGYSKKCKEDAYREKFNYYVEQQIIINDQIEDQNNRRHQQNSKQGPEFHPK